jgi:uncharacterized protein YegL
MKKGLTEVVVVLDKSGSMDGCKKDVIGGFNTLLREQKAHPGECLFSLAIFDFFGSYHLLYSGVPIKEVVELTDKTYLPCGYTALIDAVGRTIYDVGVNLSKKEEDEKPERVLFVIITDGEENDSGRSEKYNNTEIIKAMIKHQEENYSWQFIYIGNKNFNNVGQAGPIGISGVNTINYAQTSAGYAAMYGSLSRSVSNYRDTGKVVVDNNPQGGEKDG